VSAHFHTNALPLFVVHDQFAANEGIEKPCRLVCESDHLVLGADLCVLDHVNSVIGLPEPVKNYLVIRLRVTCGMLADIVAGMSVT